MGHGIGAYASVEVGAPTAFSPGYTCSAAACRPKTCQLGRYVRCRSTLQPTHAVPAAYVRPPHLPATIQIKLLNRYKLGHEVVGEGADARLRILPRAMAPSMQAA